MSLLSELGPLLQQYAGSAPAQPPANVDQHFDQVAGAAPKQEVAQGLAGAFRSDRTPPFGSMLGHLFQSSDPNQRAGLLNTLLGSVASGGAMQAVGGAAGGLGSILGMFGLTGGHVTPQQAQSIPPEAVEKLANEAEKHDPSIVDRASQFYAEHPAAVKALGGLALATIISHIANSQRR